MAFFIDRSQKYSLRFAQYQKSRSKGYPHLPEDNTAAGARLFWN